MSPLYPTAAPKSIRWPDPFESVFQAQTRRRGRRVPGARRPDIHEPMRWLIANAVALGDDRPYGMISWLADVLDTSRETIYTIGETWAVPPAVRSAAPPPGPAVDRRRLAAVALTLLVEGAVQLRPTLRCLDVLEHQRRSIGWLHNLVNEAGGHAGAVMARTVWAGDKPLIVARDELYTGDLAWLLTVDTRSHAILSGHVEDQADAETWAVSLALDVHRTGGRIVGLAEDGAKCYPLSVRLVQDLVDAPFAPNIHKDHWHLLRQARRTARDAERIALKCLETAWRQAEWVRPGFMVIRKFATWEAAHARADRAIANADAIRLAVDLLGDVLDLVDRRTGRILDEATARWYLNEIIAHLRRTDSDLAEALAGTLQRQVDHLLSFHPRLAVAVDAWRVAATDHFEEAALADIFECAIARAWRLARAVTNGRWQLRGATHRAADTVQALCHGDAEAQQLAQILDTVLDGTVRTSSASENVNSILRAYVWGRRYFRDRRTAQNWLNLLLLWYNMHVFERGKRAGHSPYQLAGVQVTAPDGQPTADWLVALGYAAAA